MIGQDRANKDQPRVLLIKINGNQQPCRENAGFIHSTPFKRQETIMKTLLTVATALALSLPAYAAKELQGSPEAGKELAQSRSCVSCHGEDGASTKPYFPNLAGQNEVYLIKMLTDFREKRRIDPTMNAMASKLSDQDIANLAAFFSSLKK